MRLAIHSASAAVTRALEAVIACGGHSLVGIAEAELVLLDSLHPLAMPAAATRYLTLVAHHPAAADEIACPIHPRQLKHILTTLGASAMIAIGGGWQVDMLARNLTHPDFPAVALTEKESMLLHTLAAAHPAALAREALLTGVWGITTDIDTHTLETHIYRLRHKLSALTPPAGDIVTEDGAYKLAISP